ncbi:hypothetical protein A33Q_3004 [Indibacter alkaliphilus LW1]|uniref:Methyltransferase domain-containing protein n=1 Tax=Indibacter alkaliphilus (strain CCUG 57479 / KCTC 22604 / LW1) TaxID=1189612 RepID=S2D8V7_INDAL|nr:methyltransferase domain-containing protein [Indibacter alkaliphilus]EOZ95642.1 hypothetical protein A33Q_3004 [Indibacter alkaliphilus LW1]
MAFEQFHLKKMLYPLYRRMLRNTPAFKRQMALMEKFRESNLQIQDNILQKLNLHQELKVVNGPFKGLNYIHKATGSMFFPKLIGSYEEPIHDWVYEIIGNSNYKKIIDIGCAEGYYAVGFAKKMPYANVTGSDINPEALKLAKQLAKLNEVNNIQFVGALSPEDLESICEVKTLIFCDIEGEEVRILDPIKVPMLTSCDILVEAHDCFVKGLTELLIHRFSKTHQIDLICDYPWRKMDYQLDHLDEEEKKFLLNENRPENMRWLFMRTQEYPKINKHLR